MRFFLPVGGVTDDRFGILASYKMERGVPVGILNDMVWGGDNNAFKNFEPDKWLPWLQKMTPYRATCLFMACPDKVADAKKTLEMWDEWSGYLWYWPRAFVAQDGQEDLAFPDGFSTLFIGGSTKWKKSQAAIDCIRRAQVVSKHIHIGRVNWGRRYKMFEVLTGSDSFTCDGTRSRYDGIKKTIDAWSGYMAQKPLVTLDARE